VWKENEVDRYTIPTPKQDPWATSLAHHDPHPIPSSDEIARLIGGS
jgi:hypothetical protein